MSEEKNSNKKLSSSPSFPFSSVPFWKAAHFPEVSGKSTRSKDRLTAVFPAIGACNPKEEEYIERMIQRDRELNWG